MCLNKLICLSKMERVSPTINILPLSFFPAWCNSRQDAIVSNAFLIDFLPDKWQLNFSAGGLSSGLLLMLLSVTWAWWMVLKNNWLLWWKRKCRTWFPNIHWLLPYGSHYCKLKKVGVGKRKVTFMGKVSHLNSLIYGSAWGGWLHHLLDFLCNFKKGI